MRFFVCFDETLEEDIPYVNVKSFIFILADENLE